MRKQLFTLFFFVLILSLIPFAQAQDEDINLVNLPAQLANAWGISTFAAGLFLSSLLSLSILMFAAMIAGKNTIILLFVGFGLMGFCIAVGWLPYWIMLLLSLLIASMWAGKITRSL